MAANYFIVIASISLLMCTAAIGTTWTLLSLHQNGSLKDI